MQKLKTHLRRCALLPHVDLFSCHCRSRPLLPPRISSEPVSRGQYPRDRSHHKEARAQQITRKADERVRARTPRQQQRGPNYYLLIFTGANGARARWRDRMLNNMGTFYKRPRRAAFYRPRPELEKCLCGSASPPPPPPPRARGAGIMYFRNRAAFAFLAWRQPRQEKGARIRRKTDGARDAKV